MLERVLIFIGFALLLGIGYLLLRRWQVRRVTQVAQADPLLAERVSGIPAILYFTSPNCAPCQYRQKPALSRLQSEMGDGVQVIEVNALDHPDAVTRWGVLSVPTTFVLDEQGQPRDVNYGVVGADVLKRQLQRVA
jgi:thioredoxin-like negative regulator of GroEL